MTSTAPYGFRVVGSPLNDRRLIDWHRAFAAYCQCDDRADVTGEAYLSAFTFGADFRRHLESTGTTKGFAGACGSPWLWVDIDREGDLERAANDARKLAAALIDRYRLDGGELLLFVSGGKGFHLGLPLSLCGSPPPSTTFNAVARRFAEGHAERLGFAIDGGVYDKVRLFRAPNSRHPKTGLHKRRLDFAELLHLRTDAILRLAATPEPFDPPALPPPNSLAVADWQAAAADVERAATARRERQANGNGSPRLNKGTLAVIRGELAPGGFGADADKRQGVGRHRLLFSAAANLAELHCPPALAHELLTEAGLDSGLSPAETRRQIDCGLAAGAATPPTGDQDQAETSTDTGTPPDAGTSTGTGTAAAPDLQAALARLWQQAATPAPNRPNKGDRSP